MLTHTFISAVCCVLLLSSGTASAQPAAVLQSVEGESITNGFVFLDGQYASPPYLVSSRQGKIFINGLWGKQIASWPPRDWNVGEQPEPPPGLSVRSKMDDLRDPKDRRNGYLAQLMRYYHMRMPEAEARAKMIEAIQSLPFVESVTPRAGDEDSVDVVTKDGSRFGMKVGVKGTEYYLAPPPNKAHVESIIEKWRQRYEQTLREGGALFLFASGNEKRLPAQIAQADLPLLLATMDEDRSLEEKLEALRNLDVLGVYDSPRWRDFVRDFRGTPSLRGRVAKFGDVSDIKKRRTDALEKRKQEREKLSEEVERLLGQGGSQ